jgi:glycosyltransferase involved in cell wall biosynthesis
VVNWYVTSDRIGDESGGGIVTYHEMEAISKLGEFDLFHWPYFSNIAPPHRVQPWGDDIYLQRSFFSKDSPAPQLAHFYSGTFSETIRGLRNFNTKIVYTAAAHDKYASQEEFYKLGLDFNLPHLTEQNLWEHYFRGYKDADIVICPSTHSRDCMQRFGRDKPIEVIPHGVYLPEKVEPLPERFTIGYLGAVGPDKGLRYLFEAWKNLNYPDATLVIAGRDSTSQFCINMARAFGGGAISHVGWVNSPSDLYNDCTVYVQPSVTEGFGIEVLEAMAHERLVICSRGVGAHDVLPDDKWKFEPCDVKQLEGLIDTTKKKHEADLMEIGKNNRQVAERYLWPIIQEKYIRVWEGLLNE